MHRARAAWILGNLAAFAGFIAVVPLILASFMPGAVAAPVVALATMPLPVALAGLAVMFAGGAIASRQLRVLDADRRRREDALRRTRHYRSDARTLAREAGKSRKPPAPSR